MTHEDDVKCQSVFIASYVRHSHAHMFASCTCTVHRPCQAVVTETCKAKNI